MFHDQRRKFRPAVARRTADDAVRPAVPGRGGASGDDALDDLIRALRDERGLAAATLVGLRRSLTPFLAWLAARGRAWQDAASPMGWPSRSRFRGSQKAAEQVCGFPNGNQKPQFPLEGLALSAITP